jgi:hypothetical protein
MLMRLLSCALLLKAADVVHLRRAGRRDALALLVLAVGIVLTFSKAIVALAISLIWMLGWAGRKSSRLRRSAAAAAVSALLLAFLLGTHLLIVDPATTDAAMLERGQLAFGEPIARIGDRHVVGTAYVVLKRGAVLAGMTHLPWGVGPGGFNRFVVAAKEGGLLPANLIGLDPHSTYLGAFAECGVAGLLAVCLLVVSIGLELRHLGRVSTGATRVRVAGLTACFLFAAVEAINTDIMNFRHYWVLLGLLAALADREPR